MRMYFKQRLFSWFDSYDIYDEQGKVIYEVKGQLSWGHCLKIFDAYGSEVGTVEERVLTFLPKFNVYLGDQYLGCISKEFSFFMPKYDIDYNGWHIEGDFLEWDYQITDGNGGTVAVITKELFHMTDQYVIDVPDQSNALIALMFVLAIDAEKCSRNNN
ncbi:MAG: LURP-one-related family protein [Acetatifactor sp.]|nr:LURP-one-related family protein [Acetatifactor sp.]